VDDHAGADCGVLPSSSSFYTTDGHATPAVPFSPVNGMIKLDWR